MHHDLPPDDPVNALRKVQLSRALSRPVPSDSDLLRRGLARQLEREPRSIGSADPHPRTEFGTVDTPFGRIMVAIDHGTAELHVHGVIASLGDLPSNLSQSLIATASAFNAAFSAEEQTTQRGIVGLIISEVLRREEWLQAKVRENVARQRYE